MTAERKQELRALLRTLPEPHALTRPAARRTEGAPYNRPAEELEWQVVTRQAVEQMGVVVTANLLP